MNTRGGTEKIYQAIPVSPGIYNPILDELENMGIKFVERKTKL